MFVAFDPRNGVRVTSISVHWAGRLEELSKLARDGSVVCPECEQALWLRRGRHRRPHFAHRHLADCTIGQQTPAVLEAKALLFDWLETKYPGRVHLDYAVAPVPSEPRPDLLVEPTPGLFFVYFVFDRQQRDRTKFLHLASLPGVHVHFLHLWSVLEESHRTECRLSASQRDFITRSKFDKVSGGPGDGHLHFISEVDKTVHILRGLRCEHPPNLYSWAAAREDGIQQALICRHTGEMVTNDDKIALQKRREQARLEAARQAKQKAQAQAKAVRPSTVLQPTKPESSTPPQRQQIVVKEQEASPLLPEPAPSTSRPTPSPICEWNQPLRCMHCGTMTTDWTSALAADKTCVCRACIHKGLKKKNNPEGPTP